MPLVRRRVKKTSSGYKPRRAVRRGGRPIRRVQVQGRTHMIKRLGEPILINNTTSVGITVPNLTQDGAGSFTLGSISPDVALTNSSSFGLGAMFKLSSTLDYADMTHLFDRYKITGVKLKFLLQNNVAPVGSTQALPVMYVAFDGDDNQVPASYDQVLSKSYCKTHILNGNRELKAFYKPRVDKQLYNGTLTTGYSSEKACWIDSNSPDVPHYGVKFWIANWNTSAIDMCLRIQPTYYLALKDPQ